MIKLLLQTSRKRAGLLPFFLFCLVLLLSINLTACNGAADEPEMVRVGVINLAPVLDTIYEGFQDQMTELGYIEGENITYVYDGATNDMAQLSVVAEKLVEEDVDLIFSISTPATAVMMQTTQEIPIIFAPISDPIRSGFVTDLAKPDANATGVQWAVSEPRRFEWLMTLDPDIEYIYIPYNPEDSSATLVLEDIKATAESFNVDLILQEARNGDEITEAVNNIPEEADAIYILPDSLLGSRVPDFAAAAIERELPLTAPGAETVEQGALMSYGLQFYPTGQQSAVMAHKILQGAAPEDLPVETLEFFLSLNLPTAEAIGIEIPNDILRQADTLVRE